MARRLDPQAAALLAAGGASARPNAHLLAVDEARRHVEEELAALGAGAGGAPLEVADLAIPVDDGATIPARIYRPVAGRTGVVVYLHGGGWVLGSVDTHDACCRALARASGCAVVSVGYRRAPEHRFPVAVHDAFAATRWVASSAAALGVDPGRLAVAGDSAGGNLAAAVALLARDRGGPAIAFQLLVYPVVSTDLDDGLDLAFDGVVLHRDELRWHQRHYLADPADRRSALVSPLDRARLHGLPPALVVTAECDLLRPQGERYAAALRAAGVTVEHLAVAGMPHGFFQLPGVLDGADEAIARAGAALRAALGAGAEAGGAR